MPTRRDLHEQNRRSWNHATVAHNRHKGDQAAWLRGGGSTLFPEELALLGPLRGRRVVHLLCNAGQDTLSLAVRGAELTGVDISDEAIGFARGLSAGSGLPATFVRADVYDWLDDAPAGAFDVAFSSYGALEWLSDLPAWARGVARALAPGGRLVVVEFHPAVQWLEPDDDGGRWRLARGAPGDPPATGGAPVLVPEGIGDYVAESGDALLHGQPRAADPAPFANPEPCHGFAHGLAEVVDAVVGAGLLLEVLREHPFANGWRFHPAAVPLDGRRWGLPPGLPPVPLMFSLAARRPA